MIGNCNSFAFIQKLSDTCPVIVERNKVKFFAGFPNMCQKQLHKFGIMCHYRSSDAEFFTHRTQTRFKGIVKFAIFSAPHIEIEFVFFLHPERFDVRFVPALQPPRCHRVFSVTVDEVCRVFVAYLFPKFVIFRGRCYNHLSFVTCFVLAHRTGLRRIPSHKRWHKRVGNHRCEAVCEQIIDTKIVERVVIRQTAVFVQRYDVLKHIVNSHGLCGMVNCNLIQNSLSPVILDGVRRVKDDVIPEISDLTVRPIRINGYVHLLSSVKSVFF